VAATYLFVRDARREHGITMVPVVAPRVSGVAAALRF
jgi:hypothetical protein